MVFTKVFRLAKVEIVGVGSTKRRKEGSSPACRRSSGRGMLAQALERIAISCFKTGRFLA